ncbi:hypothetical protein BKA66DRAFT_475391 [Pyrenochaeta sp. MPI-SDFR-AT-0127]|nr:hypothetical protein BKA66DRAFT_475391 [Pyrenochaeta sp. MPI-SDFR-AT-0127]
MNHQHAPSEPSSSLYHASTDTQSSEITTTTKSSRFSRLNPFAKKQTAHQEEDARLVPTTIDEPTEAQLLARRQKEKENLQKYRNMSEEEADRFLAAKANIDKKVEERNMHAFGETIVP